MGDLMQGFESALWTLGTKNGNSVDLSRLLRYNINELFNMTLKVHVGGLPLDQILSLCLPFLRVPERLPQEKQDCLVLPASPLILYCLVSTS